MLNIDLVYHYFAHYRKPIIEELINEANFEFVLLSGLTSEIKLLKLDLDEFFNNERKGRVIILKNWWLGKYFLWQSGLLYHSISSKAQVVVYLGNMYHLSTWIASIISRLRGKKVIFWTHGYLTYPTGIKGWIRSIFYKLAHYFFLYGNTAKSIMVDTGIAVENCCVIYNSLDYNEQIKHRNKYNIKDVMRFRNDYFSAQIDFSLCFVGRLIPQKELDVLIKACHLINEEGFNVGLLIIGDGESKKELMELAESMLPQGSYNFYGTCYNEEVLAKLIGQSDICISPGSVGLTAMHSLVYGTPCCSHNDFSTQAPEVEAIIPNETGFFFESGNFISLANEIINWQKSVSDRSKIQENCFKVIDNFYSPSKQVEIVKTFFKAHGVY